MKEFPNTPTCLAVSLHFVLLCISIAFEGPSPESNCHGFTEAIRAREVFNMEYYLILVTRYSQ